MDSTSGAVSNTYVRAEVVDAALEGKVGFGPWTRASQIPFRGGLNIPQSRQPTPSKRWPVSDWRHEVFGSDRLGSIHWVSGHPMGVVERRPLA